MEVTYRKGNMIDRGMCPWLLQVPVDDGNVVGFDYRCCSEKGRGDRARGVLCFFGNAHHTRCDRYTGDGENK